MIPALIAAGSRALPYLADAAAGIAPTVIDTVMSASGGYDPKKMSWDDQEGGAEDGPGDESEGGASHPLLDAGLGIGLGILTHKMMHGGIKSPFPSKGVGSEVVAQDPAKVTRAASKSVQQADPKTVTSFSVRDSTASMPSVADSGAFPTSGSGEISLGGRTRDWHSDPFESGIYPEDSFYKSRKTLPYISEPDLSSPFPGAAKTQTMDPVEWGSGGDRMLARKIRRPMADTAEVDPIDFGGVAPSTPAESDARAAAFAQHEEELRKARDHARDMAYRLNSRLNPPYTG